MKAQKNKFLILPVSFLFFFAFFFSLYANIPTPVEIGKSIQPQQILNHIRYLASKKLEGRRTASKGEKLAGSYIREEFQKYGLLPGGEKNTYYQKFPMITGRKAKAQFSLSFANQPFQKLYANRDFSIYTYSAPGSLSGLSYFAGYGIQTKTYNHYGKEKGQFKNKILFVLDGPPKEFAKKIPPRYRGYYGSPMFKASLARRRGAKGLVVLVKKLTPSYQLKSVGGKQDGGIPILYLSLESLQKANPKGYAILNQWMEKAKKTKIFQAKLLKGWKIKGKIEIQYQKGFGRNVISYLPGGHPKLSKEIIVIGAHYDHLGHGGRGSLARGSHAIHFGADDNASGTAVLLEIAEAFSILQGLTNRSLVFIAFSGEELGLLGSQYFVNHPTFPLKRIIAMINLDMVGRMREKKLQIFGSGTSSVWPAVIGRGEMFVKGLHLNLKGKGGFGPSDHTSFYKKKIPVLHFFTGLHKDYHKPTDRVEKINAKDAARVGELVFHIIWALDELPVRPDYIYIKPPQRMHRGRGPRPYLGIIPEYGGDNTGLVISGVSSKSPAEKAGLQAGDKIIQFGEMKVRNIYDLTNALFRHKPGDKIRTVVLRKGKKITLRVQLGRR